MFEIIEGVDSMENGRTDDCKERPQSTDLANVIMNYSPGVTSKSAIQEISGVPKKSLQKYIRHSSGFSQKYSKKKIFDKDNLILVIAGNFNRSKGANFIEIGTVKDLMEFEMIV